MPVPDLESNLQAHLEALGARVRRRRDGSLHTVDLSCNPQAATAALAAQLPEASRLKVLLLAGAPLTDAAAPSLAKLTELSELDLRQTRITDQGLLQLKALTKLTLLQLTGAPVTREGIKTLRQSLLNCRIIALD